MNIAIKTLLLAVLTSGLGFGGSIVLNPIPTVTFYHSFNNDGATGSTATADAGDNCSLVNHTWATESGNTYLIFNGNTTTAQCGTGLSGLTDFTLCGWGKASTYGEGLAGFIVAKSDGGPGTTNSWNIRIIDTSGVGSFRTSIFDSTGNADGFASPNDSVDACIGQWCHFCSVISGCTSMACTDKEYINGQGVSTSQVSNIGGSRISDSSFPVLIGYKGDGSATWDGGLDEIRVYASNSLNKFQIEWLYLYGRPPIPPPATSAITNTDCNTLSAEIWNAVGGVAEDYIQPDGTGMFDKTATQTQVLNGCRPWSPGIPVRQ